MLRLSSQIAVNLTLLQGLSQLLSLPLMLIEKKYYCLKRNNSPPQQKPAAPMVVTPLLVRAAKRGCISSHALSYEENTSYIMHDMVKRIHFSKHNQTNRCMNFFPCHSIKLRVMWINIVTMQKIRNNHQVSLCCHFVRKFPVQQDNVKSSYTKDLVFYFQKGDKVVEIKISLP